MGVDPQHPPHHQNKYTLQPVFITAAADYLKIMREKLHPNMDVMGTNKMISKSSKP